MGVKDLWQLLAPVGRRVSVESLEGKILAIDMSIWLTQFIKAMRDEEGKMTKFAHLIGTLRRILKLLYHRIRPVFVFDGQTPLLKERTIQHRRKVHERNEALRKAAVHRMILGQLKQQVLQQMSLSSQRAQSSMQYAASFRPPTPPPQPESQEQSTAAQLTESSNPAFGTSRRVAFSSGPSSAAQAQEGEDVAWTAGFERLNRKSIEEEEQQGNEGDAGESAWALPEDYSELNVEVLSSLPSHIRKGIVEEARRKERARARSNYIPVAENPLLYSQTQLANFLQTSKLNRRFEEAQKIVSGSAEDKPIAAEGGKRYRLLRNTFSSSLHGGSSSSEPVATSPVEKAPSHEESSDDEFTSRDWAFNGDEGERTTRRRLDLEDDESEGSSVGGEEGKGGFFLHDEEPASSSSWAKSSSPVLDAHFSRQDEDLERTAPVQQFENVDDDGSPLEKEEHDGKQAGERRPSAAASLATSNTEPGILHNYYADLHAADSADEGDDVAWEVCENQPSPPIVDDLPPSAGGNSFPEQLEVSGNMEETMQPVIEVVLVDSGDEYREESRDFISAAPVTSPISLHPAGESARAVDSSALDRAVATASKMADWAGRAVRRALKDHLKKTPGEGQGAFGSSGVRNEEPPIVFERARTTSLNVSISAHADEVEGKEGDEESGKGIPHPSMSVITSAAPSVTLLKEEKMGEERVEEEPRAIEGNEVLIGDAILEDDQDALKRLASSARDSERLTEEMKEEVMQLLRAFDLPYLVAPFEAEAQCAVLEQLGVVHGVITEDSDVFLFGSRSVYKNLFNDKKFVEVYLMEDVERELGLTREDLIALAFFLGSDYTDGVHGIGLVNAMEIIQAFSMRAETGGPVAGLEKFKQWLRGYDFAAELLDQMEEKQRRMERDVGPTQESRDSVEAADLSPVEKNLIRFDAKHKTGRSKWVVSDSFPDPRVVQAYMEPQTNRSREEFAWPQPIRSKVRDFCKLVLGWTDTMMDAQIDPVLQKFASKETQTRIDGHFFTYSDNARTAKIASARLRDAVIGITGSSTELAVPLSNGRGKKRKAGTASKAEGEDD